MPNQTREQILESIIIDTFWMARRYANQRKTYSPTTINNSLKKLEDLGIFIQDDHCLVADGNSSSKTLDIL